MAPALPPAPDDLAGPPRAFYEELSGMLAAVRPGEVDAARSSVAFERERVEVVLAHRSRDDWAVCASADRRAGIVLTGWTHEHFSPASEELRPWTTQMVDFVAELLRGEIEIETTFRGRTPARVRHFNRDERGRRNLLGHTGFLLPGRLLLWRPKRTEVVRVSFS